jgi:hypothetical protein
MPYWGHAADGKASAVPYLIRVGDHDPASTQYALKLGNVGATVTSYKNENRIPIRQKHQGLDNAAQLGTNRFRCFLGGTRTGIQFHDLDLNTSLS